jgi:hypothetical protein
MANTTYFGWETPDDTDLVKDGAAAIRTLGQAIDTSLQDLEGGTTGQVLSKTSNTDMDFTWITTDDANAIQNAIVDAKGDLIAASANDTPARLAVGTNGKLLMADSAETTGLKWATDPTADVITTAGDLLYGTAADTVARLGIGTAGQVLKVNSGATAPEWGAAAAGGGMTLISTTTLSGASTTISVASNTYIDLVMQLDNIDCSADANVLIQLNGETGATAYAQVNLGAKGGTADEEYGLTFGIRLEVQGFGTTGNNSTNVELYNANSTIRKVASVNGGGINGSSQSCVINNTVAVASTAVISSIVVKPESGTFDGGTVRLYGVK